MDVTHCYSLKQAEGASTTRTSPVHTLTMAIQLWYNMLKRSGQPDPPSAGNHSASKLTKVKN